MHVTKNLHKARPPNNYLVAIKTSIACVVHWVMQMLPGTMVLFGGRHFHGDLCPPTCFDLCPAINKFIAMSGNQKFNAGSQHSRPTSSSTVSLANGLEPLVPTDGF